MAGVKEDDIPCHVGDHGKDLLVGIPLLPGGCGADDLLLIEFVGALFHPLGQLPLGGAQLEVLPGDEQDQQDHAVQHHQAAHQVLVGVAVHAAHQADEAQHAADPLGSAGLFPADAELCQAVHGPKGF